MDPNRNYGFDAGLGDLGHQNFWYTNLYEIENSPDGATPQPLTIDDFLSAKSCGSILPEDDLGNYHTTPPNGYDDEAYEHPSYRDANFTSMAQLEIGTPYRYQTGSGTHPFEHSANDSRTATPRPSKKLRTAARKAKKQGASSSSSVSSSSPEPESADKVRRARRNHNNVEKQYRNRLNSHFERLIAVLPSTPGEDDSGLGDPGVESRDCNRRLSKAEVLDLARRHIKLLEKQNDKLRHDRESLDRKVGRLP